MKLLRVYLLGPLLIMVSWGSSSQGAEDADTKEVIKQLQRRIEELEQKVKTLENNQGKSAITNQPPSRRSTQEPAPTAETRPSTREVEREPASERAAALPLVSLGLNGLIVRSADSNFLMNIHGYAQADARFYVQDHNPANDTFLLRRVRPIIEGSIYNRFDYRLMADFGSGDVSSSTPGNNAILNDAYVNGRFLQNLQVQVGKYKSPVGLERLQSTAELLFIENGFATQLTPNYDLGAEVHNSLFNSPISYAIGIFNGAADAASSDADTTDEGKDVAGRLFFQPFLRSGNEPLRGLGFGVGGSVGHHEGPLPSYKTPGQQAFFSYASGVSAFGQQYRIDPQLFYYWGSFGILGEYILSSQKAKSTIPGTLQSPRFNNTAWQIEASYFLTGDQNSFRASSRDALRPAHPFTFAGEGWGAVEFVARIQQLSLDRDAFPRYVSKTSAREETAWGVGLNWYLNSNLRLYLDYEQTRFDGGSKDAGSVTAHDEHVVLGRVQFGF
jgi:phosphate-selective porin OprO/OprP